MTKKYGKPLGQNTFIELANEVAKAAKVPLNEMLSRKQRHPYPELRRQLAILLYEMGYSQSSIARRMKRHPSTVTMMVASPERRARKQRYLHEKRYNQI